jgi:hypothetical protein
MRKLITTSLLALATLGPGAGRAYEAPVIHVPFMGEGSATVALTFAPNQIIVPPPDAVQLSARAEGNLLHVTARDLVGLSEPHEIAILALGELQSATRIPIRLIPAGREAAVLDILYRG